MDDILDEISTEIDFILQRHSSNLSRFKALHGIKINSAKYLEIFEQTFISAKQEITEVGNRAMKKNGSLNAGFNDKIQIILESSLRRFILVNRKF